VPPEAGACFAQRFAGQGRRKAASVRRAEGGQQPAHEREQGKERDAEAGH